MVTDLKSGASPASPVEAEVIRIISARKATKQERERYEEQP